LSKKAKEQCCSLFDNLKDAGVTSDTRRNVFGAQRARWLEHAEGVGESS